MSQAYQEQQDFNNEIVFCPYDQTHRMKRSRLIFHFVRCKTKLLVQHLYGHCCYNFLHILKLEELQQHILTCPEQQILKNFNIITSHRNQEVDWTWENNNQIISAELDQSDQKQPTLIQEIPYHPNNYFRAILGCLSKYFFPFCLRKYFNK